MFWLLESLGMCFPKKRLLLLLVGINGILETLVLSDEGFYLLVAEIGHGELSENVDIIVHYIGIKVLGIGLKNWSQLIQNSLKDGKLIQNNKCFPANSMTATS